MSQTEFGSNPAILESWLKSMNRVLSSRGLTAWSHATVPRNLKPELVDSLHRGLEASFTPKPGSVSSRPNADELCFLLHFRMYWAARGEPLCEGEGCTEFWPRSDQER